MTHQTIEQAVVGDWETMYRTTRRNVCVPTTTYKEWLDNEVTFIASLLAAKDREIAEAYKKGFIDGGLPNLPDRPLNYERD